MRAKWFLDKQDGPQPALQRMAKQHQPALGILLKFLLMEMETMEMGTAMEEVEATTIGTEMEMAIKMDPEEEIQRRCLLMPTNNQSIM